MKKSKNQVYLFVAVLFLLGIFFAKIGKVSAATCGSDLGGTCVLYCDTASNFVSTLTVTDCNSSQQCCVPSSHNGNTAITCASLGGSCATSCLSSEYPQSSATDCTLAAPTCCAPNSTGGGGGGSGGGGGTGSGAGGGTGTNPTGTGAALDCGANFEKIGGVCYPTNTGLSNATITSILENLFSWMMGLFTLLAVAAFVISGIQYLTAAGSQDMMETAKRNSIYSIIGILVGLSGFVIVKAIAAALSGTSSIF